MSITVPPFTTIEEISRIFSSDGVDLRLDDITNIDDNTLAVEETIDDATNLIYQYTWLIYDVNDLAGSKWVRRRATYISCYLLSIRRGNPGQYIDRYNSILEELKLIMSRDLYIPGLNINTTPTPTLSNQIVDNRGMGPVLRNTPGNSVGTYDGQRTTDYPYPDVI